MNPSSRDAVRVGILSDTHGHVCSDVLEVIAGCDIAVHAGDIGSARGSSTGIPSAWSERILVAEQKVQD